MLARASPASWDDFRFHLNHFRALAGSSIDHCPQGRDRLLQFLVAKPLIGRNGTQRDRDGKPISPTSAPPDAAYSTNSKLDRGVIPIKRLRHPKVGGDLWAKTKFCRAFGDGPLSIFRIQKSSLRGARLPPAACHDRDLRSRGSHHVPKRASKVSSGSGIFQAPPMPSNPPRLKAFIRSTEPSLN